MANPLAVLIIEDSEDDVLLLLRALRNANYEPNHRVVDNETDMREALSSGQFSIVISDYVIPGFGARQALETLKSSGQDLPFIVVSGAIGEDTAVEMMKAGAHDYVMKGNLARLGPAITRELEQTQLRADRRHAAEAVRDAEERYRTLLQDTGDMVQSVNSDGEIVFVNRSWLEALDYESQEVVGRQIWDFIHPDWLEQCQAVFTRVMSGGAVTIADIHLLSKSGEAVVIEGRITPTQLDDGSTVTSAFCRNVTARRRAQEELRRASTVDNATGLPNRAQMELLLDEIHQQAVSEMQPAAIIYLNLDYLGQLNEAFGFQAADELIKAIAGTLRDAVSEDVIVGRVSGNQFAVLRPGIDAEEALNEATRLVRAVRETRVQVGTDRINATCTAGVVAFPIVGSSTADLMVYAAAALERAKSAGRNLARLYDPSESNPDSSMAMLSTRSMILDALDEDRFVLYRQPIVDLDDRSVVHYELLIRLQDANGKIRPPFEFIPQAESLGLIQQIDRRVVDMAFDRWKSEAETGQEHSFAINVSGRSVGLEFAEYAIKRAKAIGIPNERITFEITETAAVQEDSRVEEMTRRLGATGFKIAVDDFGSGTTSLRRVRELSPNFLKLDGSLVKELATSVTDRDFVSALVPLVHDLGVKIIAEFVQDEETVEFLRGLGVEYGQGYYLGMPEPFPSKVSG